MFHLFNKSYLHFDDVINSGFDRVVISEINGVRLLDLYEKINIGKLIHFEKNIDDISFVDLIQKIYDYGKSSNNKIVIYCDKTNYCKFLTKWLKLILPNLTLESYKNYIKLFVFKERINFVNSEGDDMTIKNDNAFWSSEHLFENVDTIFNNTVINPSEVEKIKSFELSYSIEFLLADYFSNSVKNLQSLKFIILIFLKRWFLEILRDSKEMVLFNLLNKNFQSVLNFTESNIDFYNINPIKNIESLKYYSDETIWPTDELKSNNRHYINFKNLTQEQINGLRDLFLKIFKDINGIDISQSNYAVFNFLEYVTKDEITKSELDSFLNFSIEHPMDTLLIPKFDFKNANTVFVHYIMNLKKDNNIEELSKFKLL
jgi:hypothetical protein